MTKAKGKKNRMATLIFPIMLILLNFGASFMCLIHKEYKMALYWLAAAILNICVTF